MKKLIGCATAMLLVLASTDAFAKCSLKHLSGRWHLFGHRVYINLAEDSASAIRFRCSVVVKSNGDVRYTDECSFETGLSPHGHAEHFPGGSGSAQIERDCTTEWSFTTESEESCNFKGALTRDKQIITGVALCRHFGVDENGSMMLTIVKQ